MKKMKLLLMLPLALGLTAAAPVSTQEPLYKEEEPAVVVQEEDPNKEYLEEYITTGIKHPDYNYIATYDGSKVIENAVVKIHHQIYCGDVYLYIINVSYFEDDGTHVKTINYELEFVLEPDGSTGIIHEDRETIYE